MINDPQLFIVPTPIGNMGDITIRAIETLKNSDLILAEDTRHAKKLLSEYKISTKSKSYHLNNEHKKVNDYVELMISGQENFFNYRCRNSLYFGSWIFISS